MRILLIEDDRELCKAVKLHLDKDGYTTDLANDGEEGLFFLHEGMYDLILLDRMLPVVDGITVLKKIRKNGTNTPVLLLTALGEIDDRITGLDAGADDYLTKPFDIRELLARIRALVRRPAQIAANKELRFGDIMLDPGVLYLEGKKGRCTLSKKESDLLETLLKNAGNTLPRNILFSRVWGVETEVEEGNLDSYAHFIRRRLQAVSERVRLTTIRGIGYKLEEISS